MEQFILDVVKVNRVSASKETMTEITAFVMRHAMQRACVVQI